MFHVLLLRMMQEAPIRPVVFSDMSSARWFIEDVDRRGHVPTGEPSTSRPRRRALRPQEKMPQIQLAQLPRFREKSPECQSDPGMVATGGGKKMLHVAERFSRRLEN